MENKMKKTNYKFYGLDVYVDEDTEYAVGTKEQAIEAAKKDIMGMFWSFRPEFIASFCNLNKEETKAIVEMQKTMCESCNNIVARIIGKDKLDDFAIAAIKTDGVGHFLSSYDGKEIASDEVEGLPKGLLAYRLN